MFKFAGLIVRNKVLLAAGAVAGFMVFGGEKQPEKPTSPWAKGYEAPSPFASTTKPEGMTDKALALVSTGMEKAGLGDYDPIKAQSASAGRLEETRGAVAKANHSD